MESANANHRPGLLPAESGAEERGAIPVFNMNANEIYEPDPDLLLTRTRSGIVWLSGSYVEPTISPQVVWVAVIVANRDRDAAKRLALLTLN